MNRLNSEIFDKNGIIESNCNEFLKCKVCEEEIDGKIIVLELSIQFLSEFFEVRGMELKKVEVQLNGKQIELEFV